jgi:hypothetical protein
LGLAPFSCYIGLPWVAGGQGPQAYDCWGFFRMVQRIEFRREVPIIIAPDYDDPSLLTNLFRTHSENDRWIKIDGHEHGCAVIVHRPLHIGIWLDLDGGGVLHCLRGRGAVFTKDAAWHLSGFGRKEYRRFAQ